VDEPAALDDGVAELGQVVGLPRVDVDNHVVDLDAAGVAAGVMDLIIIIFFFFDIREA
jgi:hypothetical protein